MTGADLANLLNEAALLAARQGQAEIHQRDLTDALEKIQLGTARNVVMPEEERRRTAYHEGGHALLGMIQVGADPVRKVSIIPRGRALGVTLSTPEMDRYGYDTEYLRGRIIGALGGHGRRAGGPRRGHHRRRERPGERDPDRPLDGRPLGHVGSRRPGLRPAAEGDPRMAGASDELLNTVDEEVRRLIDRCYQEARRLLRENRTRLDSIAEQLLKHETLDEADAYAAAGIPHDART